MADPYATTTPDLSGRPAGPPPWQGQVLGSGGSVIGPDSIWGAPEEGVENPFVVVACCGIGTLAPFARLDPAMATLLWLEHAADPRRSDVANELLLRLAEFSGPILAIKQGAVGGPLDRPGCLQVGTELVGRLLEARESIRWERDPDFGYEIPAAVPGLSESNARALMPRLLYADNDRVYEHAELVAKKKRDRYEMTVAMPGLDPTVVAIAGWPPRATSNDWRD